MELRGRAVVVTGASSGIGRAACRAFAGRGARVIAVARRAERLEALAAEVPEVVPVPADVTEAAGRDRLLAEAGPVDVLVNNAGRGHFGLVEQMTGEEVSGLFEVNVLAPMALTRQVLPGMLERRRGAIVNTSSVAAYAAAPPLTVYSATKFAKQGFSEGLRREVDGRGVTVATVNPGPVRTEFVHAAKGGDSPSFIASFQAGAMPPSFVAAAIVRAATRGGRPGYRETAVPRLLGVIRLAALPTASRLLDLASVPIRTFAVALGQPAAPGPGVGGDEEATS